MTGRPLKYKNVEDMQKVINEYFESCKGEVLKDSCDEVILNKYGEPVIIGQKPPTVTGLALALGFNSRQSLLNYNEKLEFMDTITRAKSIIEEYTETRLFDKDGVNGAKFSLTNNFRGWKEKTEIESNNTNTNYNKNADDMSLEEIQAELAEKYGYNITKK